MQTAASQTLTRHQTNEMRAAWHAGYDAAMAGIAPRSDREFKGQPGRNLRNYKNGYLHGALDRKAGE